MTRARGTVGALSDCRKCRHPPLGRRRRGLQAAVADVGVGFDGSGDDPGFDDVFAVQLRDDTPPRHDDHLIAQPFKFRRVRGIHDDRRARTRYLAQNAIDFGAGANIHALRRFVGDDQARLRQQGARHHDFLLIAA